MLPAVADYRELARRRLSRFAFDYLDRGAEDGQALATQPGRVRPVALLPACCGRCRRHRSGVEVLGRSQSMPVIVGPTGLNGLYWPRAEEELARAAHAAGVPFVLSTASTSLLEDVRAATDGELWLQLYVQQDRRIAADLMRRAESAGYTALMLTVDTAVHGKRDHDVRNGFRMPLRSQSEVANWTWCRILALVPAHAEAGRFTAVGEPGAKRRRARESRHPGRRTESPDGHESGLGCDRVATRPLAGRVSVKGHFSVADADRALVHGVDGIVLSNHGGRQLESAPSALEVLPAVIDAVGGRIEVLVDGGVRRGSDIAKARAMGAKAVLLGRAPLYGLAASGSRGVADVLRILRDEYETTLRLLGCASSEALNSAALAPDFRARLAQL